MKKLVFAVNSGLLICLLGTTVATAESYADVRTGTGGDVNASTINARVNWEAEDRYWRDHYATRPYYQQGRDYNTYRPAYEYGANVYRENGEQRFSQLDDAELRQNWERHYGDAGMDWNEARGPVMDSYNRLYENNAMETGFNSPVDNDAIQNDSPAY